MKLTVEPPGSPAYWARSTGIDELLLELQRGAEERAQQQAERERREALPPLYVVHVVHGTYARRSRWPEAESEFCRALRSGLGWRARIETWRWSGRNSITRRARAAERLRQHLEASLARFPQASHVVVAHSHGGSVAFMAVDSQHLAERLLGVVTLATPFMSAQAKPGRELIDLGTGLFASLFAGWAVLFYGFYRGQGWALWPWALAAAAALMLVLSGGAWVAKAMRRRAEALAGRITPTALSSQQVAIVRMNGDEAIAALTGARLAGSISDLVWSLLSTPLFSWMDRVLDWIDFARFRSTSRQLEEAVFKTDDYAPSTDLLRRHPGRYLPQPSPSLWQEHSKPVTQIVSQTLPAAIMSGLKEADPTTQMVAMIGMGLYGLPAALALLLVVMGIPVGLLMALSLIPCSPSAGFAGPFLNLAIEPVPAGSWEVRQFDNRGTSDGLSHSKAHESYEVRAFIGDWIRSRAIATAALDPR